MPVSPAAFHGLQADRVDLVCLGESALASSQRASLPYL